MKFSTTFIFTLFLGFLVACSPSPSYQSSNHSAVLYPGDDSGIGGTGKMAGDSDSGIGGTGIVGEITGFGSIFVNGEEIEIDDNTKLVLDGKKVISHPFAKGEIVAIHSVPYDDQHFAREIHIRHEVIGQVQNVYPDAQRFTVLGQTIAITSKPVPKIGQAVAISGFRDNQGLIHATQIKQLTAAQPMVIGQLRRHSGGWFIGQQQLILPEIALPQEGQTLRVRGDVINNSLQVKEFQNLDSPVLKLPVSRLLLQGYVKQVAGNQYRIANHTFSDGSQILQKQFLNQKEQPVRLELRRSNEHWILSRHIFDRQIAKGKPQLLPDRRPNHSRPTMPMPGAPMRPPLMQRRF